MTWLRSATRCGTQGRDRVHPSTVHLEHTQIRHVHSLETILSSCMRNSALLKADEYMDHIISVLARVPERVHRDLHR